jgi:hypothetical protein
LPRWARLSIVLDLTLFQNLRVQSLTELGVPGTRCSTRCDDPRHAVAGMFLGGLAWGWLADTARTQGGALRII